MPRGGSDRGSERFDVHSPFLNDSLFLDCWFMLLVLTVDVARFLDICTYIYDISNKPLTPTILSPV